MRKSDPENVASLCPCSAQNTQFATWNRTLLLSDRSLGLHPDLQMTEGVFLLGWGSGVPLPWLREQEGRIPVLRDDCVGGAGETEERQQRFITHDSSPVASHCKPLLPEKRHALWPCTNQGVVLVHVKYTVSICLARGVRKLDHHHENLDL